MECNKDEALRAKVIAERKMQENDFEAAQRIARKAQSLFPDLENIKQLLMVCDVHCAAQSKIMGSEKDLYAILQVEKSADEATIKKQYRKLALILHPDKNKLPGAEAAFKLIGEANLVLLDSVKRSLYDSKCRTFSRSTVMPPNPVSRNPPASKQFGAQSNIPNGFGPQFSYPNHQRTTTSSSSVSQEAFWTCCPFCCTKYQYHKRFVNNPLKCQRCTKPFVAYDLGAQGMPSGFTSSQPGVQNVPIKPFSYQPACSQNPRPGNTGTGTTSTAGQARSRSRTMKSESGKAGGSSSDVGEKMKTKAEEGSNKNAGGGGRNKRMKVDAGKPRETRQDKNRGRKRGRKQVVAESSESFDTLSSDDDTDEGCGENGGSEAGGPESGVNGVQHTRRSSRLRQNVSYNERKIDDDNDFQRPPKRAHWNGADGDEVKKETSSKPESDASRFAFPAAADKAKQENIKGSNDTLGANFVEIQDDSDVVSVDDKKPNLVSCPDPEFHDFVKDEKTCFAVGQTWALYDDRDGMPRFYAQIKKVFKPQFKLLVIWLEADPRDEAGSSWANQDLPFGCGHYRLGEPFETEDPPMFSHVMTCVKGKGRSSFVIYPSKGEIWALFSGWDINWTSHPDREYKYEIVEVLSDFVENAGVEVAYLQKVEGFVSIFKRSSTGADSFLIPPNELLRFSNMVPFFRMSGTEKEGVPVGSFELDPAALPINHEDIVSPRRESSEPSMSRNVMSPNRYAEKVNTEEVFYMRRSPRGSRNN